MRYEQDENNVQFASRITSRIQEVSGSFEKMPIQKDTDKTISLISLVSGIIVPIVTADYVYRYLSHQSRQLSGWELVVLNLLFLGIVTAIESYFVSQASPKWRMIKNYLLVSS
jgi:hypothetical protein